MTNVSWHTKVRFAATVLLGGCVALASVSAYAAAPVALSFLTNAANRHNLSDWASHGGIQSASGVGGTDQICIFCHTPHGAAPDGPLWSRPDASGTFVLYGQPLAINDDYGGSIKDQAKYYYTGETGAPVGHVYPNGASRLCMSCHDGVTAIGLLRDGNSISMTGSLDPDGSLDDALGSVIDLSTTHPISFIYSDAVAASIDAAYVANFGPGSYYQGPGSFNSSVSTPLDSDYRMQCTTCHDPHYDVSLNASYSSLPPFWRQTTTVTIGPYDDVCNNCHVAAPSSMTPVHPP